MTPRARILCAVIAALAVAAPALAVSLPERTFLVSATPAGSSPDGVSTRPQLSADGGQVVFQSTATNLAEDPNGAVQDVFLRRFPEARSTLISAPAGGGGADGPSSGASVGGGTVAFTSAATNLVDGDTNGVTDVFARRLPGAVRRVSQAPDGTPSNGASSEADVSENGRFVAFTSTASNLVGGDANGVEDVFVADVETGAVTRVSNAGPVAAAGRSRQPAISADGRYVSFTSTADDLVVDDLNRIADVFVADRVTGRIERVSVDSREDEQNRSVAAPFPQVSDVSANGRIVVFDSDADNLVSLDRNDDTDVFVRDRVRGVTTRASVDTFGREGDNDSFNPSLAGNGRHVVFSSFATNLARGDHPTEDVFLRDLSQKSTVLASVSRSGFRRGDELVRQLLQRPSVSRTGDVIAFTSTTPTLVTGDGNRAEDAFVRVATPPQATFTRRPRTVERTATPRFAVRTDDPNADSLLCTVDDRPFDCAKSDRVAPVGNGTHVLRVRAGGPGMRFEEEGVTARFRVTGVRRVPPLRPTVAIQQPTRTRFANRVSGTSRGGAGVVRVEVLIVSSRNGRCHYYDGRRFVARGCDRPLVVIAQGTDEWFVDLAAKAPRGQIVVRARAVDAKRVRSAARFVFSVQR